MSPVVEASRAAALESRAYRPVAVRRLREFIERESVFSWLILTPPVLVLLAVLGLFNRLLVESGLAKTGPSWLGTPTMAMISVIMVNTWRGLPFFGISILAGLQTIPVEQHESATIDGAGTWDRFRHVTLPSLLPVIFIVTTFSIILTFFDFQLVYVLTGGGPANSTPLMATYAYSLSLGAGQMGLGSAGGLSMVPVLGLLLVLLTFYVRKG